MGHNEGVASSPGSLAGAALNDAGYGSVRRHHSQHLSRAKANRPDTPAAQPWPRSDAGQPTSLSTFLPAALPEPAAGMPGSRPWPAPRQGSSPFMGPSPCFAPPVPPESLTLRPCLLSSLPHQLTPDLDFLAMTQAMSAWVQGEVAKQVEPLTNRVRQMETECAGLRARVAFLQEQWAPAEVPGPLWSREVADPASRAGGNHVYPPPDQQAWPSAGGRVA